MAFGGGKIIVKGFLFLSLLVAGCGNVAETTVDYVSFENNVEVETYFCPNDDCGRVLIKNVDGAKSSVYCALYDLDFEGLISTFSRKSNEIDVKVIIDKFNYDGQIKGDGVKIAKTSYKMHNKFCIFDGNKVWTGSTNPTNNGCSGTFTWVGNCFE